MNMNKVSTCPDCNSNLEYDEGTPSTCINGVPDEGNEPCHYCEECGHEEELPCYREQEEDGSWWCVNDHTGCLYNDGNNGCNHLGCSVCPLNDETK